MNRVWSRLLACLLSFGLISCGGGSGDGGATATPSTPPATPSDPAPAAPTVSGRLWHSYSAVGSSDAGTYVSPLDGGASRFVVDYKFSTLDRTGQRLVSRNYDATPGAEATAIRVTALDGAVTGANFVVTGYATNIQLSPSRRGWMLARWGQSYLSPSRAVVYDFEAGKLLFDAGEAAAADRFDWLPDGRLVRVRGNGSISTFAIGEQETPAGAVTWPGGWQLGELFMSPDGQNLAVRLDSSVGSDHDLWVGKLDGTGLGRFTTTLISTYAVWSPDGKYLAFNKDTGSSCSEATCVGTCRIWFAPVAARNIVAVESSKDAFQFTVQDRNGQLMPLGCQLLAWTR